MSDVPADWAPLVEALRAHVSPEWSRQADENGEQGWIRLVLMVDAHDQLSRPRVTEKVAMTMADLAAGHEREREREGWEAIQATAREERVDVVSRLVDAAERLLSPELVPLFFRSIEPSGPGP